MVDSSEGQFYTMEGMAAAVLMVFTAYLVMSATTVYTPGDTHIIDMQLEQIGYDALKIMDMKNNLLDNKSDLEYYIKNMNEPSNKSAFTTKFLYLLNNRFAEEPDRINFTADVYYINASEKIEKQPFTNSSIIHPSAKFSGNENTVRVSRWVFVKNDASAPNSFDHRNQTVLLEVLLWRG